MYGILPDELLKGYFFCNFAQLKKIKSRIV